MFKNNLIVSSSTEFPDLSLIFEASKYQDFLSTLVRITSLFHHLIHITVSHSQSQIDKLIKDEFKEPQEVQKLKNKTKEYDQAEMSKKLSDFLNTLWISAVIILIVWWWAWLWYKWIKKLKNNKLKREIRKEILDLTIKLNLEKQKYPNWFISKYITKYENNLEEMKNYTDEELNEKIKNERLYKEHKKDITTINESMLKWDEIYKSVIEKKDLKSKEFEELSDKAKKLKLNLELEKFKIWEIDIPTINHESNDISETVKIMTNVISILNNTINTLENIPDFYNSIWWVNAQVNKDFLYSKKSYIDISNQYTDIYWDTMNFNIEELEQIISNFNMDFSKAYKEKDIDKLNFLYNQSKDIFNWIKNVIQNMQEKINWYQSIPNQISKRKEKIQSLIINPEHKNNSEAYIKKTNDRKFSNFNLESLILNLKELINRIHSNYLQKKEFLEINDQLKEFDNKFKNIEEYMWLWLILKWIIAQELAESERRKRQEEERKRKREEDDERSRRREEDDNERRSSSLSSPPSWDNWSPGWGWWFGWGWADDD